MPAVFLHGVPDTIRVWDPVLQHLARTDIVVLPLPGFDEAMPPDFTGTKEAYVASIIGRLEALGEPVDLVGHDWGCLFVARVASLRPDLVRTWAAGHGPVSAQYEWHPLAKIWQTPEKGEQWMRDLGPHAFSKQLESLGVPDSIAPAMAERVDDRMKQAILHLYRSAVRVGAEWEPDLARITSPGLVFWGTQDEACPVRFADELAADTRARQTVKLECGHWSILQQPAKIAAALQAHWAH